MPIYMRIDGVDGESESPGFAGFFDIFVTSWGVEREVSGGFGGGGGGGTRPDLSDVTVTKPAAKGSPKLFLACCSGAQIPRAEIIYTEMSGDAEVTYMVIRMEEAIISGWNSSGDGGAVPTENLSLNFAKIEYEYTARDGTTETNFWDKKGNSGG